jgi:4-hydroxy-2-oxoheptanedioate aldolase
MLGAWCGVASSYSAELICSAGVDWICIDTQHGMVNYPDVLGMLQASALQNVPAIVRVPAANDAASMMRALDAGAAGVLVPLVNTKADAELAASACRYPPHGSRSWGPARALPVGPGYSAAAANGHVLCAVQIETKEALENLEAILSVDGVDMAFVGPTDLALSMGLAPEPGPQAGEHLEAIAVIARACHELGVRPGIYAGSADVATEYIELGYDFVAVANDAILLREGARSAVNLTRSRAQKTGD